MSESATPAGGRVVGPDGAVSYDFDGHVRARGLDLDQHQASYHIPEDPSRFTLPAATVSWYRPDGSPSMELYDDPDVFYINKGAATTGFGAIRVSVDGTSRILLGEDGSSDFVQPDDLADVVRSPDAGGFEAVFGSPGLVVTDQYAIAIDNPCGQLTGHDYDIDLTDSPVGWGWPSWTIVGYYSATPDGPAPVSAPSIRPQAGNVLRFQFISLATSLSLMQGTYVFNFIGNPNA